MFFAGNRCHAIPLFVSANVLPLDMLYFETVCSLMHDTTFIHICITLDFLMLVIYILRIQLNSFSIFKAKLWNCLKPDLRKLRKEPYKNKIHQFLLAVLDNEDDCVHV